MQLRKQAGLPDLIGDDLPSQSATKMLQLSHHLLFRVFKNPTLEGYSATNMFNLGP